MRPALGGTWTLDATTGPTPGTLPADFSRCSRFDGLLLSATAQIHNAGAVGSNPVTGGQTNFVNLGGYSSGVATDSNGDVFVTGSFSGDSGLWR